MNNAFPVCAKYGCVVKSPLWLAGCTDFIGTPVDYIFLQFPLRDLLVRTAGQAGFREPLPLELSNGQITVRCKKKSDAGC